MVEIGRALFERVLFLAECRKSMSEFNVPHGQTYDALTDHSFRDVDAVVNLAGENVGAAMRWTESTRPEGALDPLLLYWMMFVVSHCFGDPQATTCQRLRE